MKRHGNLWNKFISYENLYSAYLKARKGRRHLESVQRFEQDVEGISKNLFKVYKMALFILQNITKEQYTNQKKE